MDLKLNLSLVSTAEDHYIRLLQSSVEGSKTCLIIADHTVKTFKGYKEDSEKALFIKSRAAQSSPADAHLQGVHQNGDKIIEIYGRDKGIINAHINLLCKTTSKLSPLPPAQKGAKAPEIIKIVDGGDPANRIDVVFMGVHFKVQNIVLLILNVVNFGQYCYTCALNFVSEF